MRTFGAIAAIALAACGDNTAAQPDGASPATAITITLDLPPGLVAFREGATGPWQAAAMKTATTFEADVHGPYVVAVQCVDHTGTFYGTTEYAQTPDDPHDLMFWCDSFVPASPAWSVTGQMVQAGAVWFGVSNMGTVFGNSTAMGTAANWSYTLDADTGTYDLMAVTPTAIGFRRAIAVSSDLAVTPAIDLTQEGAPLVATAFSVTNPASGETSTARVNLDNDTLFNAHIYRGALATAMVAPDSQLIATDRQSVSIYATAGAQSRGLSQPFRAGDPVAYTLPPQGTLALGIQSGQLVASWTSLLPDFDSFDVEAVGLGVQTGVFDLEMTPAFATATQVSELMLDTNIPGYIAAQGIDFAKPYERFTDVEHTANNVVTWTSSEEQENFSAADTLASEHQIVERQLVTTARARARWWSGPAHECEPLRPRQ